MILYKHHLFAGWPNCLSAWDTSHHWLKNQPGKTVPVAYSSQDTIKARAKWLGDVDPAIQNSLYAYFQITVGGNIHKSNPVHLIKGSDGSWVVDNQSFMLSQTIAALYGQKARYDPTFTLTWKFYIGVNGNANARDAGVSNSCLYVTYGDPVGGVVLYHTVVDIGCRTAHGETTEQGVFDAIWENKFKSENGSSIDIYRVVIENGAVNPAKPNNELYYYGIVSSSGETIARDNEVNSTKKLLQYRDGLCTSWSYFLSDILKAQGLAADPIGLWGKPGIYPDYFNRSGQKVTHVAVTADPDAGVHHNQKPLENRWDTGHAIIKYNNSYYDSSYGYEYGSGKDGETAIVHKFRFEYRIIGSSGQILPGIAQTRNGTEFDPKSGEEWIDIVIM